MMNQAISDTSHFELHLTATSAGQHAIDLIAQHVPLSKQKLKSMMSKGAVWLETPLGTHRLRRAKKKLQPGDTLHVYYDESILNSEPSAATLIADEADYSIWNKPYGMYSQGTKWGDHCTIYRYAEQNLLPERPAFLVHRLDRAASGLIILAHSKKMAALFSQLFVQRSIVKRYTAVVEGTPELELPYTICSEIDNKPAISRILAITPYDGPAQDNTRRSSVTIEIETGRKHQIRKHLAEIGYPIVGDRLYGSVHMDMDMNLQLQSTCLHFTCPLTGIEREYKLDG